MSPQGREGLTPQNPKQNKNNKFGYLKLENLTHRKQILKTYSHHTQLSCPAHHHNGNVQENLHEAPAGLQKVWKVCLYIPEAELIHTLSRETL